MYCYLITIFSIMAAVSSCSSNTTETDTREVEVMDSVSTDLDKSSEELDAQAKKVEASLEKIEKEQIADK